MNLSIFVVNEIILIENLFGFDKKFNHLVCSQANDGHMSIDSYQLMSYQLIVEAQIRK